MLFLVFLIMIVVQNKSHKVKSCSSWQGWTGTVLSAKLLDSIKDVLWGELVAQHLRGKIIQFSICSFDAVPLTQALITTPLFHLGL